MAGDASRVRQIGVPLMSPWNGRSRIYSAAFCLGIFSSALSSLNAHAYIPTLSAAGATVRWFGKAKLNLAGNPQNQSGLSPASIYASAVRGLQRWKQASGGGIDFDYWQGTDPGIYLPNSEYNGLSSFYFASNAKSDTHLSPNVLGLTQVWYNTSSGQILETDIVLNDRDFHFTENPTDTSGFGSGGPTFGGARPNVFIENVLTHELGHAFGLSHSAGLQSTMLFMESPEQAHLSCDEQTGIHALYASPDAGSRGSLSGQIISDAGGKVFGAHVLAISRHRGTVLASAITDRAGNYVIQGLEPGAYFLMAEPYYAGANALPAFYSGLNPFVCPGGEPFSRTAYVDSSGFNLQTVGVPAGGNSSVAPIQVHCHGNGSAAISSSSASSSASAPTIYNGSGGVGIINRLNSKDSFYRMGNVSGHVEIHALGFSLYSPVKLSLSLQDGSGNSVAFQSFDPVYVGDSGYVNYDSGLTADGLPPGDYYLRVSATSLSTPYFPAGTVALDSVQFAMITGSVNEGDPALSGTIPLNGRCRASEQFASYSSPPGNPPRGSVDDGNGGVGFCGTVAARSDKINGPRPPSGPDAGPNAGAMIGWLLPWAFMGLSLRLIRRLRVAPVPARG